MKSHDMFFFAILAHDIFRRDLAQAVESCESESIKCNSGLDGVLFDLGVSSMQLDDAERGFSFLADGPLDMRMDQNATLQAADIVNSWSPKALEWILREYGEERNAKQIAERIANRRSQLESGIQTTAELVSAIGHHRGSRKQKIHPATRTFQAIRIAVNDELHSLEQALPEAFSLLAPGGRLAAISFHSLEDRIVKRFCREHVPANAGQSITKRPIEATDEEVAENVRARSAKLRVVEKYPVE